MHTVRCAITTTVLRNIPPPISGHDAFKTIVVLIKSKGVGV